jgi:hypothetical protein
MGIENEVDKTPREHFDEKIPKAKERTLQRSNFDRHSRIAQAAEPRTQLLALAEIWRDLR